MLTQKQRLFIKEYLLDHNATAAAKRSGYSIKNADKIGAQLLGKTRVSEAIQKEMNQRMQNLEIKSENILKEMAEIAFFKPTDILDINESNEIVIKPPNEWPINAVAAIKHISTGKNGTAIHFHNKIEALKLLGDHLGLWEKSETQENDRREESRSKLLERVKEIMRNRIEREKDKSAN